MNHNLRLALLLVALHPFTLNAGRLSNGLNKALAYLNPCARKKSAEQEKKEYKKTEVEYFIKEIVRYLKQEKLSIVKNNYATDEEVIREVVGRTQLKKQSPVFFVVQFDGVPDKTYTYTFRYSSYDQAHDWLQVSSPLLGLGRTYADEHKQPLQKKRNELKTKIAQLQGNGTILSDDAISYFTWLFSSDCDEEIKIRSKLLEVNNKNYARAAFPVKIILASTAIVAAAAGTYLYAVSQDKDDAKQKPILAHH